MIEKDDKKMIKDDKKKMIEKDDKKMIKDDKKR